MRPPFDFGIDRRGFLKLGGLAGLGWMTPVGELLAQQAERGREPARSVILLWLAGGPSQSFEQRSTLTPIRRLQVGRRRSPRPRKGSSSSRGLAIWPGKWNTFPSSGRS